MRSLITKLSLAAGLFCLGYSSLAQADIEIRKNGSSWGSASSCCGDHGSKRTVAAVLAFFAGSYF